VDRAGSRDRIWLVAAGQPWRPSIPLGPGEAREALTTLSHTDVGSDLTGALARAGALLDAAGPELREIVLVSDLRRDALPPLAAGAEARSDPVTIAPPPRGAPASRGVAELRISGGLAPRAGEAGDIQVEVRVPEAEGAIVRGYVANRLVATATTGPTGIAILPLPPLPAGWVEGRVELDPDHLRADDTGYFAFRAIPPPTVGTAGSLPDFLFDALAVLEDAGRIRIEPLVEAAVHIIGAGAIRPPGRGGTVILVPPEDPALLPSANRLLEDLAPGWRIEAAEGTAEGLEREVSGGSLLGSLPVQPLVRFAYRLAPGGPPGSWTELLTLSDGEPWLIGVDGADGLLLVLGSPLAEGASDLPTSAGMIPFLDLVTTLPFGDPGDRLHRTGDVLMAPAGAVSVRTPRGASRTLGGASLYVETQEAGIYHFLGPDGEILSRAAVNTAPPAFDPPFTPDEAAGRLADVWNGVRVGDPWPETVLEGRSGREVGRPLAALLFVVLLAESWLAASPRRGEGVFRASPGELAGRTPTRTHSETAG
jgi:hypothetical protein